MNGRLWGVKASIQWFENTWEGEMSFSVHETSIGGYWGANTNFLVSFELFFSFFFFSWSPRKAARLFFLLAKSRNPCPDTLWLHSLHSLYQIFTWTLPPALFFKFLINMHIFIRILRCCCSLFQREALETMDNTSVCCATCHWCKCCFDTEHVWR